MLCSRKSSQQPEMEGECHILIEMVLCASQQCSQQGKTLLPPALGENAITFLFFPYPVVAEGNFPTLMLEYFFSPGILVHFFFLDTLYFLCLQIFLILFIMSLLLE